MKHTLLTALFAALAMLVSTQIFAQRTVVGKVTDATTGEPLPGATVRVKAFNQGTVAEPDGTYRLGVSGKGSILVFAYTGYETQEHLLDDVNVVNIALAPTALQTVETVVVGSRNSSRTKLTTAVPVDIIPIQQITNDVGQVDLNQILTYVAPSFQSARQTVADGTDHIDPAQLRGLGPDQILVLINGKRRHQSALVNVNGTVNRGTVGTDLGAIPATAIERIEILRDGAAAQYGSDAIAGVINIILKKKTGVLDGSVSYGQHLTEYAKNYAFWKTNQTNDALVSASDGQTVQGGLNYGFKIGAKGFINLTGEYTQRGATNRAGTYTGTIYAAGKDDSILNAKKLTRDDFDMRIGNSEIKGGGATLNFEIPFNNAWDIYAFGGFNKKQGNATGFFRYPSSITSGARTYADDVFAIYPNGFLPAINSDVQDLSMAIGTRGKAKGWNIDLSNTFGQNNFDFTIDNSVNYTQAAIAPTNLQTSFDAGGLKFLQNTTNLDFSRKFFKVMHGLNMALGAEHRIDLFGIRAGEESSFKNYDSASGAAAGAQVFSGFLPANEGNNSRNCIGLYADVEQDFTTNLMFGAAVRFENYSDFGSTVNGKLVGRYRMGENFTLRASASTGFRAPSMQQRFYAKTNTLFVSTSAGLVPVESGTFTNDSRPAEILGIPKLKEETSLSFSVGATARPAKGLELTIDAYQIDIDDRIVLTNNFTDGGDTTLKKQLAEANAGQANFFTNAVDTRARGIEVVISYSLKFGKKQELRLVAAGSIIDNEVKKDADGKPIIHASETLEKTGQIGKYFNREDQSRIEVASPKQKISATATYSAGKFGVMLRAVNWGKVQYLDPTIDPTKPVDFPKNAFNGDRQETLDQTFRAKTVLDLSLSYKIIKGLGLTLGVNNLLDTYQDAHTHSGNVSSGRFVYSRRVQQMGFNGRYVFGRVKFDF